MSTEKLIGKTIQSFKLNDDKSEITFETTEGPITLTAHADCCSYTWIEDLDNPEALIGKVSSVEDLELPEKPSKHIKKEEEDCVAYYGLKVTTDKGDCTIDYRNNSNGYYGGSLE